MLFCAGILFLDVLLDVAGAIVPSFVAAGFEATPITRIINRMKQDRPAGIAHPMLQV